MFKTVHNNEVLTPLFALLKRKTNGFVEYVLNYSSPKNDDEFWSLDADLTEFDKQYIIRRHLDDF